jgi:hypothetical protein
MTATHLLCAMAMCAPLVLEARAAELPAQGSAAVSDTGRSAGPTSGDPDRNRKAGRPESSQTDSSKTGSAKGIASNRQNGAPAVAPPRGAINARRGGAQLARTNADRVRSMLHKQTPRTAGTARSPVASKRAVQMPATAGARGSANPAVPGSPVALARLSPLRTALRSSPSHAAPDRGSSIGGASITTRGRVGGSPMGRAANPGAIDGTQVHRSGRGH